MNTRFARAELHLRNQNIYLSLDPCWPARRRWFHYANFGIWQGRHIWLVALGLEAHLIWNRP